MFDNNNVFTSDNYNSDEVIYLRGLLASLPDYSNFSLPYGTSNCTVSKLWRDNMNYVVVTENSIVEDVEENMQIDITTYIISWYKNRGSIDSFIVNDNVGDRKDYDQLVKILLIGKNKIEDMFLIS